MAIQEHEIYGRVGPDGFERLAAAFYRQIPTDDILGPMYPSEDLVGAEARLKDFLVYRFGGPQKYIEERGHPRLRMRHAPFAVDQTARDRWMKIMEQALLEVQFPEDASELLRGFFDHMSTFLINR
jgi:hemoglobin